MATSKAPLEEKETAKTPETEKMVKIKMPLTRNEKDDVFVSVNMRTWLIKRGVISIHAPLRGATQTSTK